MCHVQKKETTCRDRASYFLFWISLSMPEIQAHNACFSIIA